MKHYEEAKELGAYEMWQRHIERTNLMKEYLDLWNSYDGLDALLGPTTPYTAPENGKFKHIGFTGVFNILDYSSVSFPTGIYADKTQDVHPAEYKPLNDVCKAIHDDCKYLFPSFAIA